MSQPSAKPDRIARAFVSGTAWIGMGCALQAAIRLAFIAVLTKHLNDEAQYGYWSILVATAEILSPLAALGLTFGYLRHNAGLRDPRRAHRNFLGTAICVAVSAALVSLALALLAGAFARAFMHASPLGRRVVLAGAALILCTALEWCLRFYYSTQLQMGRRALLATGRFALELVAVILAARAGCDLVQIVLVIVAARALPQLIAFAAILRANGLARPAFDQIPAAVRYGLPMQLASTAGTLTRFSDRLVLGAYGLSEQAGAYSAVYEICAAHLMVVVAIEAVLLPVLSALANRGQPRRARWMYLAAVKYLLIATVPAAVIMSVAGRPILLLVTRRVYVAHLTVEHYWIAWGALCYGVAILARCLLAVAHRTVLASWLMWATVALKLLLLVLLVRWFGMRGAAVATFATFFLLMAATLTLTHTYATAGLPSTAPPDAEPADDQAPPHDAFSLPALALTALAAALAAVPLRLLAAPTAARTLAALAAYALVYAAALFALRAVSLAEIRTVLRLIRSRSAAR